MANRHGIVFLDDSADTYEKIERIVREKWMTIEKHVKLEKKSK